MYCKISTYLAYLAIIYIIGSIYYIVVTRSYGTPFRNSLTPEQKRIKNQSVSKRKQTFYMGLGIGAVLLLLFRPFKEC